MLCWKSILIDKETQAREFWWSVLLLRISLVHQAALRHREWDVKRTKAGKPQQPVMRHTTSAEKALTAIYLRPMQPKANLCNKELNYAKTPVKLNSAWMVSQARSLEKRILECRRISRDESWTCCLKSQSFGLLLLLTVECKIWQQDHLECVWDSSLLLTVMDVNSQQLGWHLQTNISFTHS